MPLAAASCHSLCWSLPMKPKLPGASPRGFAGGEGSSVNHRQLLALDPAHLPPGKTTQLVSTWILQQEFSGLCHPPPAQTTLSHREVKLSPAIIEKNPVSISFHRLFAATGISALLHLPTAPAALRGERKVQPPPAGRKCNYFLIVVKHSYLTASESS